MKFNKNFFQTLLFALLVFGMSAWGLLSPDKDYTDAERRPLAQFPDISAENILSGEFMADFESYSVDQLPARDSLRSLKSLFALNIMQNKDSNGVYQLGGHLSKLEYPLDDNMLLYACQKFEYLYNTYLKDTDTNPYLCIVPDKNRYLNPGSGYLNMDYDRLYSIMHQNTPFLAPVRVDELLDIDDYYRTDTHWKQENLLPVANALATAMKAPLPGDMQQLTVDTPFYGVYCGQLPIGAAPDSISYLTSDILKACTVTYFDGKTEQTGDMYNLAKAGSKDAYELFLSGVQPFITIESPMAKSQKELVVFRDSFGSSLIPLLAESYSKITVVDIRYMRSDMLGRFITFDDQDVLFLYSTLVLNSSTSLN